MSKKIASPELNQDQPIDKAYSTAESDRRKISAYLTSHGSLTTLFAREELGVMSPAPRILELRRSGRNIVTHMQCERDITGRKHRQANYVLMTGKVVNAND